jgi:NMD protein affecting ribosome stability and mRNA decay
MIKVYPGPYGTCPHCHKLTPIRLNSLIAQVKTRQWEIDPSLVKDILASVVGHAREGKTKIQKKVKVLDANQKPVIDTVTGKPKETTERVSVEGKLAYCSGCNRPANRLFWIDMGSNLSEPFCKFCLSEQAKKIESEDGVVPNVNVYSYSTTLLSVAQALLAYEGHPAPAPSGVSLTDDTEEGLF